MRVIFEEMQTFGIHKINHIFFSGVYFDRVFEINVDKKVCISAALSDQKIDFPITVGVISLADIEIKNKGKDPLNGYLNGHSKG